ncbi:MAG: hypothetical protein RBT47_10115, partial [Anaerolineae bacterium]|nr:hypothetical protein [Anaerolineae bacterium]
MKINLLSNWKLRSSGLLVLLATLWYLPWLLSHLNWAVPWLALPFAAASLMTAAMTLATVVDHWQIGVPEKHRVPQGQDPEVAVIVPTYGEPPMMVYETLLSVLTQDYPK